MALPYHTSKSYKQLLPTTTLEPEIMEDRDQVTCQKTQNDFYNDDSKRTRCRLVELREPEIAEFVRLNVNVFETQYSRNYYNDIIKSGEYSKLAYAGNELTGGIAVRIQVNNL